jgi:hypothetical protein
VPYNHSEELYRTKRNVRLARSLKSGEAIESVVQYRRAKLRRYKDLQIGLIEVMDAHHDDIGLFQEIFSILPSYFAPNSN